MKEQPMERPDQSIRTVMVNNNTYLSIAMVVMLVGATVWIKNGQAASQEVARQTAEELRGYKEVQVQIVHNLTDKLDALAASVKTSNETRWGREDAKIMWRQFKVLNPKIEIPDVP